MARSSVHLLAALCATAILASPAAAAEPDYGDLSGGGSDRSALDQYREAVPAGGSATKLSRSDRRKLDDRGEAGRGYAGVLSGEASSGISGVGSTTPGGTDRPAPTTTAEAERAPAPKTTEAGVAPDGDASLGPVPLWLAVALTALVAAVAAVVRWRRAA